MQDIIFLSQDIIDVFGQILYTTIKWKILNTFCKICAALASIYQSPSKFASAAVANASPTWLKTKITSFLSLYGDMSWKQSIFEPCGVDCCFQVNTKCGKMWNVKFKRSDNLKAGICSVDVIRLSSIYILHQTLFPLIFFHSGKYFALPVCKINCLINCLINKLRDQHRRLKQM